MADFSHLSTEPFDCVCGALLGDFGRNERVEEDLAPGEQELSYDICPECGAVYLSAHKGGLPVLLTDDQIPPEVREHQALARAGVYSSKIES